MHWKKQCCCLLFPGCLIINVCHSAETELVFNKWTCDWRNGSYTRLYSVELLRTEKEAMRLYFYMYTLPWHMKKAWGTGIWPFSPIPCSHVDFIVLEYDGYTEALGGLHVVVLSSLDNQKDSCFLRNALVRKKRPIATMVTWRTDEDDIIWFCPHNNLTKAKKGDMKSTRKWTFTMSFAKYFGMPKILTPLTKLMPEPDNSNGTHTIA